MSALARTTKYSYDEENRLRQAVGNGTTAIYAYDPSGRRRSKTVNGTITYFVSDGANELAAIGGSGNRLRFYVNANGADDRIGMYDDGLGTWRIYHTNHQGSVLFTTTIGGAILDQYHYGAFGEPPISDAATGNPFRYTGRYLDAETGLYYYRARYYSSKIGRFLQNDPVGVKDDLNLYAYTGNDPLNRADPTGNGACEESHSQTTGSCGGALDGKGNSTIKQPPATGTHIAGVATSASGVAAAQQGQGLTNVVYNETSSLKPDPKAKPGDSGSAENLAAGRQAVAEIANRVIDAGYPGRVAPSVLTDQAAAAIIAGNPNAVDALNKSQTAADLALGGSNITNGATQYRTRVGSNVANPLGSSATNRGTPVSQSYGPFVEGKHTVVIVVAP